MVDFVHPYPPGSMDDPVLFPNDSDMSDRSGRVREDKIDHQGIFNEDLKRYTHNLKVIKRILND